MIAAPSAPAIAAFAACALLAAGCGSSSGSGSGGRELVVFAASSLGPAFERYEPAFERAHDVDVRFSFAGSDALAAQIRQGVTPDVYAAADTELPDALAADGLLQEPRVLATNRLVVGVPAGSELDSVSDLEQPGVSVALGSPDVPVGSYTRDVLDALGPAASRAINANVATSEPDVAGIVAKLSQGAVDAGFVYESDVEASGGRLEAIELPSRASPDVAYGIAVTSDAGQSALAQRFVNSVRRGAGARTLRDLGFGTPPPGS